MLAIMVVLVKASAFIARMDTRHERCIVSTIELIVDWQHIHLLVELGLGSKFWGGDGKNNRWN